MPEIVAKVNGEDIKKAPIVKGLKKAARKQKNKGKPFTADLAKTSAKQLIEDEIGKTLLVQKAKAIGIRIIPLMVNNKIAEIKKKFKSDAVFEHKLADQGLTMEQLHEEIRTDLWIDELIKREVEYKVQVARE